MWNWEIPIEIYLLKFTISPDAENDHQTSKYKYKNK